MADIALTWDLESNRGDWSMDGPALATGNEPQAAVLISLFTDRMAQPGDVIPDGSGDPRGWWADDDVPIGSRLWLIQRSKQTPETLQKAYDYIAEALQWLISDGVVAQFDISVQWIRRSYLGAWVIGYKQDGTEWINGKYIWAWSNQN